MKSERASRQESDQAQVTADPLHLMTVFAIPEVTAMDCPASAHPGRFPVGSIALQVCVSSDGH